MGVREGGRGPGHLQVAGGRRVVDLDVGAVGRRQRQAIPEPQNRGAGVGFHLAADVGRVPLPRVDHHRAQNLGSICSRIRIRREQLQFLTVANVQPRC